MNCAKEAATTCLQRCESNADYRYATVHFCVCAGGPSLTTFTAVCCGRVLLLLPSDQCAC